MKKIIYLFVMACCRVCSSEENPLPVQRYISHDYESLGGSKVFQKLHLNVLEINDDGGIQPCRIKKLYVIPKDRQWLPEGWESGDHIFGISPRKDGKEIGGWELLGSNRINFGVVSSSYEGHLNDMLEFGREYYIYCDKYKLVSTIKVPSEDFEGLSYDPEFGAYGFTVAWIANRGRALESIEPIKGVPSKPEELFTLRVVLDESIVSEYGNDILVAQYYNRRNGFVQQKFDGEEAVFQHLKMGGELKIAPLNDRDGTTLFVLNAVTNETIHIPDDCYRDYSKDKKTPCIFTFKGSEDVLSEVGRLGVYSFEKGRLQVTGRTFNEHPDYERCTQEDVVMLDLCADDYWVRVYNNEETKVILEKKITIEGSDDAQGFTIDVKGQSESGNSLASILRVPLAKNGGANACGGARQ